MKILKTFLILIIINLFFLNCEKRIKTNYDFLLNKSFGLIIENTQAKNDVRIYYGSVVKVDDNYFFVNTNKSINVSFDDEQLARIKQVPVDMKEDVKSLQNCDYSLWMKMGDFDKSTNEMRNTGIIWK